MQRLALLLRSGVLKGRPLRGGVPALCLAVLLAVSGCGYHFAVGEGQPPGNIRSVAVAVLDNRTTEVGIESLFTNAILDEFIRWQRLPVKPQGEADATLTGRIRRMELDDVSHLRAEQTLETRVTVTLALRLQHNETGETLWENRELIYYEEYQETGNPAQTDMNRRRALGDIAEFLAEKIHRSIFQTF
jgi:hypothetical protein